MKLETIDKCFSMNSSKSRILYTLEDILEQIKNDSENETIINLFKVIYAGLMSKMKSSEKICLYKIGNKNPKSSEIEKSVYKANGFIHNLLTSNIEIYELSSIKDGWIPPINWELNPSRSHNTHIIKNVKIIRNNYNEKIRKDGIKEFIDELKQHELLDPSFDYDKFKNKK